MRALSSLGCLWHPFGAGGPCATEPFVSPAVVVWEVGQWGHTCLATSSSVLWEGTAGLAPGPVAPLRCLDLVALQDHSQPVGIPV